MRPICPTRLVSRGLRLQLLVLAAACAGAAASGLLGPQEDFLRYPARPLPAKACACRVDMQKRAVPRVCPSPWESPAGTRLVAPALKLTPNGDIVEAESGKVARLHGINVFGWETDTPNIDGLWAYNDEELPPTSAITPESLEELQISFWGKRTMTNDFAHVTHRIKSLGFNAVRLPFNFTNLQRDIPAPKWDATEFYACVRDSVDHLNLQMTLDPRAAAAAPAAALAAAAPAYTGMPHPPPVMADDEAGCALPWEAPFAQGFSPAPQFGSSLRLTMCNWYLPQGLGVQAIHRFLWQVQYFVSQGFYVIVDHHSYAERDPNMLNPALFAANWGNLWRMISELPGYERRIKGRVFPDLVNEPSRWGCQWERECLDASGQRACATGSWLYHEAMQSIHAWDDSVPIFANAMGQARIDPNKFPTCTNYYEGMNMGEGMITHGGVIHETGISDPLTFFQEMPKTCKGKLVLAPHVYPATLTGFDVATQARDALFTRMDLSFGLKALGKDSTSDMRPLDRLAVVLGEFGVQDHGQPGSGSSPSPGSSKGDFTRIDAIDVTFLKDLSDYLGQLEQQGATVSWFWWAWNANSGDTKGIVGPTDTWRDVQFTKVHLLSELFGLRPWYCAAAPEVCGCPNAGCEGMPKLGAAAADAASDAAGIALPGEKPNTSAGRRMKAAAHRQRGARSERGQ